MSVENGPDQVVSGPEVSAPSSMSRRSMLRGAAGAGVAGIAVSGLTGLMAGPAMAAAKRPAAPSASRHEHDSEPVATEAAQDVMVHVKDAASGEMDVFAGDSVTRLRDPSLAARLVRSAGISTAS